MARSSLKMTMNKQLFVKKHQYDQINSQKLLVTDPYLKNDLEKINKRMKVYQDEILIRDKNIRDLTESLE